MIDFMCYAFEDVFLSADQLGAHIYWGPYQVLPVFVEGQKVGYAGDPRFGPDGFYCSIVSDERLSGAWIRADIKVLARNWMGQITALQVLALHCQEDCPSETSILRQIDQPEFLTLKL